MKKIITLLLTLLIVPLCFAQEDNAVLSTEGQELFTFGGFFSNLFSAGSSIPDVCSQSAYNWYSFKGDPTINFVGARCIEGDYVKFFQCSDNTCVTYSWVTEGFRRIFVGGTLDSNTYYKYACYSCNGDGQQTLSCSDSDNGKNIYVVGNTHFFQNNIEFNKVDSCTSTGAVQEWFCQDSTTGDFQVIPCPDSNCNAGACPLSTGGGTPDLKDCFACLGTSLDIVSVPTTNDCPTDYQEQPIDSCQGQSDVQKCMNVCERDGKDFEVGTCWYSTINCENKFVNIVDEGFCCFFEEVGKCETHTECKERFAEEWVCEGGICVYNDTTELTKASSAFTKEEYEDLKKEKEWESIVDAMCSENAECPDSDRGEVTCKETNTIRDFNEKAIVEVCAGGGFFRGLGCRISNQFSKNLGLIPTGTCRLSLSDQGTDFCFEWTVSLGKIFNKNLSTDTACLYGWIATVIMAFIALLLVGRLMG